MEPPAGTVRQGSRVAISDCWARPCPELAYRGPGDRAQFGMRERVRKALYDKTVYQAVAPRRCKPKQSSINCHSPGKVKAGIPACSVCARTDFAGLAARVIEEFPRQSACHPAVRGTYGL
jgi:hypothetical protein